MRSVTFSNDQDSQILTEERETLLLLPTLLPLLRQRTLNIQLLHLLPFVFLRSCVFCTFRANEPYELSSHWADFKPHKQAPANNWGLNTPQRWEREREGQKVWQKQEEKIPKWVAWWVWEQFYLSYQILSCTFLFQAMRRTTADH